MRTAFFPVRMLASLPADNAEALAAICTEFERFDGHARESPEHHDDYVEALGILRAFATARDAQIAPPPDLGPQRHQNITGVKYYFTQLRDDTRAQLASRHAKGYFESKTDQYLSVFAKISGYEFSDPDFKRLLDLINELRDLIPASTLMGDEQRRRLLRKLESFRAELHRRTNDIERFWGFLGEASIAMRKFGEDFSPIGERVLEIARITIGVIFAREGVKALPELSQLLAPPE
ncbi:MAG TPA: hypothetical protein VJA21_30045 [Verrucomicrobiae bacterium]